jgi:hypothetical protein
MTRRVLALLALLTAAVSASAAWHPVFDTTVVRVEVGQSRTVGVSAMWTGLWVVPWTPWEFQSSAPPIAAVSGRMDSSTPGLALVTGISPGNAAIRVSPYNNYDYVLINVVCGNEDPIQPAIAEVDAIVGKPVALKAETPIAHRTAFAWYHGRVGDTSQPLDAVSAEATLVPQTPGVHYAWVMARTPCSSSTAEFRIEVRAAKQRAVRR